MTIERNGGQTRMSSKKKNQYTQQLPKNRKEWGIWELVINSIIFLEYLSTQLLASIDVVNNGKW